MTVKVQTLLTTRGRLSRHLQRCQQWLHAHYIILTSEVFQLFYHSGALLLLSRIATDFAMQESKTDLPNNSRTKLFLLQIHELKSKKKGLEAYRSYHLYLHCNSTSVIHTQTHCHIYSAAHAHRGGIINICLTLVEDNN